MSGRISTKELGQIEFSSAAQQATYEQVKTWMRELFGEMAFAREDAPAFSFSMGSSWAQITVWPWGNDDTTVTARSWVVRGADVNPDLMSFLLHENDKMRFGAFGLDSDNDIFFEHSIVGSSLNKNELKATVMAVITTSDNYDDQIRSKWGGQRGLD